MRGAAFVSFCSHLSLVVVLLVGLSACCARADADPYAWAIGEDESISEFYLARYRAEVRSLREDGFLYGPLEPEQVMVGLNGRLLRVVWNTGKRETFEQDPFDAAFLLPGPTGGKENPDGRGMIKRGSGGIRIHPDELRRQAGRQP